MWWTNWAVPKEYTPEEIRDPSDVYDNAMRLFKDRGLMYPCYQLMDTTSMFAKASIFDIRSLPSWHKSRVCLIGDAAHAVFSFNIRSADIRYLLIPVKELRWRWRIHPYLPYSSLAVSHPRKMYLRDSRRVGANESRPSSRPADDKRVVKLKCLLSECILGMHLFTYFSVFWGGNGWLGRYGVIGSIGMRAILTRLSSGSEMVSW